MKDIVTFVGDSGKIVAAVYEQDGGMFQVNLSEDTNGNKRAFTKFFNKEDDATSYAENYVFGNNQSQFLSE